MKRVLVIAYYWPPSGGSGVQRWVKMCKYLPSCGWQPVVYTPLNPAVTSIDTTLEADIPPEVEVLKRAILEPGQFAGKTSAAQVTPINSQKKNFKQKLMMWIRGNVFIPDPRIVWVRPSVSFLKRYLKEHPVDIIVSTGPPHSMHLIARKISLEFGIPWVADFRDPWTKMFYFKHLGLGRRALRLHLSMEKTVLDNADCVVAVSPLVQEDFKAMTDTRIELITNGFDLCDFDFEARTHFSSDKFTILHAGLFAADGNPSMLWEALAALVREHDDFRRDFRLLLCGKTDRAILESINAAGLGELTRDIGYVDHSKVVALMKKAAVLILPLRKEPEYRATLPGKLFEYLASRRPVLGIGQQDGAMAAILSESGAGTTFDWPQQEKMQAWISEKYLLWKEGKLADNMADISKYERSALARRYAELFNGLLEEK